jgi:DnaJ-class molecular chaperone
MTQEARPNFTCKVCAFVVIPRFLPPTAPSCPTCGADTTPNQSAIDAGLTVFCASCHTKGNVYESDSCTNCGEAWSGWAGGDAIEQLPEAATQGDRVLYESSRGPEGGTVPRWKIV